MPVVVSWEVSFWRGDVGVIRSGDGVLYGEDSHWALAGPKFSDGL